MKKNVFYIPLLVILMLVCFPAALYGLYYNKFGNKEENNVDNSNFIKITDSVNYTCNTSDCFLTKLNDEELGIIKDRYVFINDGNILLYDINNNETVLEIDNIKELDNNMDYAVVSENSSYGVYDFSSLDYTIEPSYKDMYMINGDINRLIINSDAYYLINLDNEIKSNGYYDKISDINEYYAITEKSVYYYDGTQITEDIIDNYKLINNVLVGYIDNNLFIFKDGNLDRNYSDYSNAKYQSNENEIYIYDEIGNLVEEYLLN